MAFCAVGEVGPEIMCPVINFFNSLNTHYKQLQFVSVLEGVLSKLSRYDEGTFFSSILSFTVSICMRFSSVVF